MTAYTFLVAVVLGAVMALGAVPRLGGIPTIDFSCARPDDLLTGQRVVLDPPEIKGNEHLTITSWGTLKEDVAGGTVHLKVLLDKVPLLALQLDLCEQVSRVGQACPIKKGFSNVSFGFDIPPIPIQGTVEADVTLTTNEPTPREITCLKLKCHLP